MIDGSSLQWYGIADLLAIRFFYDKSALPFSISDISCIFITAMKRFMKLFAVASPLIIWGFFYLSICYGFGGLTWLVGILPTTFLILWTCAAVATVIVGCCASGIYLIKDSSKKVLYFVTLCHDLLFLLVLFSWMLQHFHFFNWLGNRLLQLAILVAACWFGVALVHVVDYWNRPSSILLPKNVESNVPTDEK